jgi:hypothetical protein
MAAPSHTTRTTPTGNRMDDGFRTLVTIAGDPDIKLWEKAVTPSGLDGGDAINISTMHNTAYRTFNSSSLKTSTEITFKCAYDPAAYDTLIALTNLDPGTDEGCITVKFPSGVMLSLHGYLKSFEPDEIVEGQQPEATVTLVITHYDSDGGAESGYTYGT